MSMRAIRRKGRLLSAQMGRDNPSELSHLRANLFDYSGTETMAFKCVIGRNIATFLSDFLMYVLFADHAVVKRDGLLVTIMAFQIPADLNGALRTGV